MLKLGIKNFFMVGIIAVLFIVMAKVIVTKYPNAFKMVAPVIQSA